jgi:hypothetical protein
VINFFKRAWIFFFRTPKDSIFRDIQRPNLSAYVEFREGSNFLVTKILCDICKNPSKECNFDYHDRKWKCKNCDVNK